MRKALTTFLLNWPILLLLITAPALAQKSESSARKLINAQGCKACHTLEGAGGNYAVSLEEAMSRLTADQALQSLVNPEDQHGDGRTPDFSHLSTEEIEILVDFLTHLEKPETD